MRLRSLGDSVLMTPSLQALKSAHPHLRLAVLVEAPFRDVFAGHPAVDELLVLERGRGTLDTIRRRLAMGRELRRRRFDLVLNYHGGSTSAFLVRLAGAPWRAGYPHYRNPRLYTHLAADPSRHFGGRPLHTVEYQLALLAELGLPVPDPVPHPLMNVPADAAARTRARLADAGLAPGGYVLVHPTATLATKQWPPESFAAFIAQVRRQHPALRVALSAGPREAPVLEAVCGALGAELPRFTDLSVAELAALIADAVAFVGCDSGPAHIAAAVGQKVLVVWGSSNAVAWRPWGTTARIVQLPFPCNPCPGYTCAAFPRPRCILDIQPDLVFESFNELLHTRTGC